MCTYKKTPTHTHNQTHMIGNLVWRKRENPVTYYLATLRQNGLVIIDDYTFETKYVQATDTLELSLDYFTSTRNKALHKESVQFTNEFSKRAEDSRVFNNASVGELSLDEFESYKGVAQEHIAQLEKLTANTKQFKLTYQKRKHTKMFRLKANQVVTVCDTRVTPRKKLRTAAADVKPLNTEEEEETKSETSGGGGEGEETKKKEEEEEEEEGNDLPLNLLSVDFMVWQKQAPLVQMQHWVEPQPSLVLNELHPNYNHETQLIVFRASGNYSVMFFKYDIVRNIKTNFSSQWMALSNAYHTLTVHKNFLFVIGGRLGFGVNNLGVYKFDLHRETWQSCGPAPCVLINHTTIVSGDCFYVIGGNNRADEPSLLHQYSPSSTNNAWVALPSCPVSLGPRPTAVMLGDTKILAHANHVFYIYDVSTYTWVLHLDLRTTDTTPYESEASVSLRVIENSSKVEIYGTDNAMTIDMETKMFVEPLDNTRLPRTKPNLFLLGPYLVAVGGTRDGLCSYERWNGRKWECSASQIFFPTSVNESNIIEDSDHVIVACM